MKQLTIFGWLLLGAAAVAVILSAPPLQNDMGQFLPDGANRKQQLLMDEIRHGPGGRLVLLEISGASPASLAAASKALAEALRKSGHFPLTINGSAMFGGKSLEELFEHRYLIAPFKADAFSASALKQALTARLTELASPLGMTDKQRLPADPTASFRALLHSWQAAGGTPRRHHGVWFSADSLRALLILHSRYPVFDLDRQRQAVDAIHRAFRNLSTTADMTLRMSGPLVFAVEARRTIRSETQILSVAAGLGVSLLLLLAFRSLRLMLLAALPLASGVLAGSASVILLFGEIHAISLAFGITLIGVALDYPIHLFSHAGGREGIDKAVADIWPILRLGLITTALGFCTLLLSDFSGLSQLGGFAISGLVAAATVTRFVLPQLVRQVQAKSLLERPAAALFQRFPLTWLPPFVIALAAAILFTRGEQLWEHELADLSPISGEARALDRLLRSELGAPDAVRVLLISDNTAQGVLEVCETLEQGLSRQVAMGNLQGFDLPTHYLPSIRTQQMNREALPEPDVLRKNLQTALDGLPFKPGLFEPFLRDIERSRSLQPLTLKQLAGTPLGLRLSQFLSQRGERWIGVATLSEIGDEAAIKRIAADAGEDVYYLNLSEESARMVAGYRDEALKLSAFGVVLILLVLAVALRDLHLTVRVVTPVAAAVLGSAAILSLMGQQLSLFHIAALLLVMGLGIDYALFVVRTPSNNPRFAATAGSLLLCNLSTLMVFGLLATSRLPVLFAIGMTVAVGTVLSLIFSVMMVHVVREEP